MKKTLGILFYFLGALLIFSIIGNLRRFITDLMSFMKIFSSDTDAFQKGEILGALFIWVIVIVAIFYLFKYGSKFIRIKK